MNIIAKLKSFGKDEDGAVTVDWVVLTAALVGLGIAVLATIEGGLERVSQGIQDELSSDIIDTTFGT
ncbi:MAG: pilus assembly protein [Pseudomonadota bacterium]